MNYEFDYDFIRDYQPPGKWVKIANALGGIGLLIYGITQILEYLKQENILNLSVGLISILGGLGFLVFGMNGSRPLIRPGQYYLRIANQKIYLKLGKYAKRKEAPFDEIDKIDVSEKEIVLKLENGEEVWINMSKIQNESKRNDLLQLMKSWHGRKD